MSLHDFQSAMWISTIFHISLIFLLYSGNYIKHHINETWYYMWISTIFPYFIYILLFFIISTLFHCMELRYRLLASQWGPHLHRSEKTQLWGIVPRLRSQSFELKPIIFPGLDKFNVLETTSPLYSVFDPRWPLCCLLHTTILVFFSPDL